MQNQVRVSLAEDGNVLFAMINKHGEHDLVELSPTDAEAVLFELHSIVMTLRGHALPAKKNRRWFDLR